MMKKFFAIVSVCALMAGAAFAATKEISGPATISGAEFSHVTIRFPGGAGTQEEDLGQGDSFELPAGYTMVGTVREYKKLEIKRAATPAPVEIKRGTEPAAPAATEPAGVSKRTGKAYSSSWEALMASRKGKETAAPAAAPAASAATPVGLTIGAAPAQPAPAAEPVVAAPARGQYDACVEWALALGREHGCKVMAQATYPDPERRPNFQKGIVLRGGKSFKFSVPDEIGVEVVHTGANSSGSTGPMEGERGTYSASSGCTIWFWDWHQVPGDLKKVK